jgi:hypothetical protein
MTRERSERPAVALNELTPELRKKILARSGRKRAPRRNTFPKDRARTFAIRMLAAAAELTPSERARVLAIAARMNNV